jgi:hypothetical protein
MADPLGPPSRRTLDDHSNRVPLSRFMLPRTRPRMGGLRADTNRTGAWFALDSRWVVPRHCTLQQRGFLVQYVVGLKEASMKVN